MARSRPSASHGTRLGAWGLTAALVVLAPTGIERLEGTGSAATAGVPARRLQPQPAAPAADTVAVTVVTLTNEARAAAGVAALAEHPLLDAAATAHAVDQAAHLTMTHTGSDGSDPGQRMRAAGFAWRTWGENVAAGQTTPAQVVRAWLNSAGHRANMLNPAFIGIGVGAVTGANGVIYWTMDLAA